MKDNNEVSISIDVNKNIIYSFNEILDQKKITQVVEKIEKLLNDTSADLIKIKSVCEILIEVLQNIIKYSYDSSQLPNTDHKLAANAYFSISYNTQSGKYFIECSNLINNQQKVILSDKLALLKDLDETELRKLARQKMRTREDMHDYGSGLGLIVIAKKSSKPIECSFNHVLGEITEFKLFITI